MKSKITTLLTLLIASATFALGADSNSIEITANDTMQYSAKAFEVKAGQEVTLVFKNLGKLPKAAMGHNVVVLKPGSNVATFAASAVSAVANEYIPTDDTQKALIIAHTKLLGPGEEDTITFTLPAPGAYPFLCSFPGHFALMQGIITAK
ncbi:MAG: cupredoxin domain-containing protein [Verrucomicrobiae bacterium]|nr:cupredoxin domain-containing protein [Verrucomicrobiae bacterium]